MKKYIFLFSIGVLAFLGGCSNEAECPLSSMSLARFEFLDSKTHAAVKLTNGATVTGFTIINDTVETDTIFNKAESYMTVPLSYTNKTTYVIHYTENMRDTIELTHKNHPFVSDIGCPALLFFDVEDMRYTTNALDSVKLVNPNITNEEKINFHIYYRTASVE